jgi:hypothetical protein
MMNDEEKKLSRSTLRELFSEQLDEQDCPVKACGCEEPRSSFLLRNNQKDFYEQMQVFIDKAVSLGVIIDTENDKIEERYVLTDDIRKYLILFKYID